MRKTGIFLTLWFALIGGSASADFKAGVATRIVTPQPLLPVSGGVSPSQPSAKTLGDLTVRALVLEDKDTRVAVTSADFLGFSAVLGVMALGLVPFIHVTVYWFRTLHPDPVVMKPEGPSLPSVMLVTLLLSVAVCTVLYVGFVTQRYALAVLRDVKEEEAASGLS